MLHHPSGLLLCGHCGSVLQRQQNLASALLVLLALVGFGAGLTALSGRPDWPSLAASARLPAPQRPPLPRSPQPAGLVPGLESTLLQQLRALVANPPRFDAERLAIGSMLTALATAGVRIELTQPRKSGAAGEWDPAAGTMRIKPQVVQKGSQEFARVLNHEAIHVAQSCSNRGLRSNPRPLGLPSQVPARLAGVLDEPLYRTAPERVRQLEREAYANQHRLGLGAQLVRRHC